MKFLNVKQNRTDTDCSRDGDKCNFLFSQKKSIDISTLNN